MKWMVSKAVASLFALAFFIPSPSQQSQGSNVVFLLIQRDPYQNTELVDEQAQAAAILAGECKPAEIDPEGNWGPTNSGIQLSIRAKTNKFVAGESMPVCVFVRNTTTNVIDLPCSGWMGPSMLLKRERTNFGTIMEGDWEMGGIQVKPGEPGFVNMQLSGQRQQKYEFDLAKPVPFGSLQPGNYSIRAIHNLYGPPDHRRDFEGVSSGVFRFKVVAPSVSK